MQEKFFSIIVVALNPGKKLLFTLESILMQSFQDYEIILKDGGSQDQSITALAEKGFFAAHPQIVLEQRRDQGIYEGMNQGIALAKGRFLLFLNCGDCFYDSSVLEKAAKMIEAENQAEIYYGDQFNQLQNTLVRSAPKINDFTCYRNVPCHQVCFYSAKLFTERGYDCQYRIRADYEHFLYCIYKKKARAKYLPMVVAFYEGGGFSETAENRKRSRQEHREITVNYLGKEKAAAYGLLMGLSLAPIRTWLAQHPVFSRFYQGIKGGIYRLMGRT